MPSEKVLEQKKALVGNLAEKMGRAAAGVLVKYEGIKVDDDTKLRAAMRAAGVDYTVIKNTLIGKACEQAGFEGLKSELNGMIRSLPQRSSRNTQTRSRHSRSAADFLKEKSLTQQS